MSRSSYRKRFDLNQMQPRPSPVDYTTIRPPLSPTSPTSATTAAKRQSSSSSTLARKRRRRMESCIPYPGDGSPSLADDELEGDIDSAPVILRVRVPPSSQARRRNRMNNSQSSISSYTSFSSSSSSVPSLTSSPSSKSSSLGSMTELENSLPSLSIDIATPPATPPQYFATLNNDGGNSDEAEVEMDLDERHVQALPHNSQEKLYIRIRVPQNMRLKP